MDLKIDFNSIKSGIIAGYRTAVTKTSEWMGRVIAIFKSGTEKALPYLQDKRIAVASLVGVNLILVEIGELFDRIANNCLPGRTNGQKIFREAVGIVGELGIIVGGIIVFSKHTKLPLRGFTITCISMAVVILRASCRKEAFNEDQEKQEPKKNEVGNT